MAQVDEVVDDIIRSLAEHPDQWEFDHYAAAHSSGLRVWVANNHYGLAIQVPDGSYSHRDFGGVTGWSSFFGAFIPWRRRLLRACREAAAQVAPAPVLVVARELLHAS